MRADLVRGLLLALTTALAMHRVVREWVQVPVIDGRKSPQDLQQAQTQPSIQGPLATPEPSPSPSDAAVDHVGPPGPDSQGVYTIRRTVGDSFSNKDAVVEAPHPQVDGPGDNTEATEEYEIGDDDQEAQESVFPLQELREAHQTLLRQSTAPVDSKINFLRRLKNKLLKHIATLAPISAQSLTGSGSNRASQGRGHKGVGFPSNEGTLMSLAFLVFAVFLVKVVMQLIYAVQNSQNNNNAGVRVAQMQIPDNMMPGAMGTMMGTMMNMMPAMMPAMMPPMMSAMDSAMVMRSRSRRHADIPTDALVDQMAEKVLDAARRARARLDSLAKRSEDAFPLH